MTETVGRLQKALAERYRIERELGAGGMASVYLAHDIRHDRDVAIKVLHPELGATLGGDRFLTEIRTTARLQHPHILPLLDSGDAGGLLFYVMPVVTGESLRDRLTRERQLPIPEAVRIAREVASALDYAHRHGVIHRDIKPENILLHDGQALVADFGIALAVSQAGGTRMTETGMSLGTPHYMSPEQAMGEREITARSDVYALGCVTYEMLTGDPPFTGSTAQAIVAKVMTDEPMPPRRPRKTVPESVEAAVLTALEKLPADRFPSAAAFAEALTSTATVPLRVGAGARGVPTRRWLADWRSWAALAVAAGSLAGTGALWVRGRERAGDMSAMSAVQNTFGREAVLAARWTWYRPPWLAAENTTDRASAHANPSRPQNSDLPSVSATPAVSTTTRRPRSSPVRSWANRAMRSPRGEIRISDTYPPGPLWYSARPVGYSSRTRSPNARVTASREPSGDQSASPTPSMISRGAPPPSGMVARVPK